MVDKLKNLQKSIAEDRYFQAKIRIEELRELVKKAEMTEEIFTCLDNLYYFVIMELIKNSENEIILHMTLNEIVISRIGYFTKVKIITIGDFLDFQRKHPVQT